METFKTALKYKDRLIKAYFKPVPSYKDMMLLYCLIPTIKLGKPNRWKNSKLRYNWLRTYKERHDAEFSSIVNEL